MGINRYKILSISLLLLKSFSFSFAFTIKTTITFENSFRQDVVNHKTPKGLSIFPLHTRLLDRNKSRTHRKGQHSLLGKPSDEEANGNEIIDAKHEGGKKITGRRIGGRKSKPSTKIIKKKNEENGIGKIILTTVALIFILKSIFGLGGGSYYYYESTYYETRTIDENGKVQTMRKESSRSNVPNLMPQQNDFYLKDQKLSGVPKYQTMDDIINDMLGFE